MKAIRVLGLCGLLSAAIGTIGGALGYVREAFAAASFIMLIGNIYAILKP